MIKTIVYKSNAGHTKRYAQMLSDKLEIPSYSVKEAKRKLKKDDGIIYLGWLFAGKIKGLKKALKRYKINCCGAVGAYPSTKEYVKNLRKANKITLPLFYMQGGIDYTKINFVYKKVLTTVGEQIAREGNENKKDLVEMFVNGKDYVEEKNINEMLEYIQENLKIITSNAEK